MNDKVLVRCRSLITQVVAVACPGFCRCVRIFCFVCACGWGGDGGVDGGG